MVYSRSDLAGMVIFYLHCISLYLNGSVLRIFLTLKSPLSSQKNWKLNFKFSKKSFREQKISENMSRSPEKETPTAPPPNEVHSPSVPSVITSPPVAGYPVQQIPLQGVPMVQNQPYPAAYPQHYQQQYHPTQPGQIVISPIAQTTPLMGGASGVHQFQDNQQYQQQAQLQYARTKDRSEENNDSEDCCDVFSCCLEICNDCFCCCCDMIFNSIGKLLKFICTLFVLALIAGLILHFLEPYFN